MLEMGRYMPVYHIGTAFCFEIHTVTYQYIYYIYLSLSIVTPCELVATNQYSVVTYCFHLQVPTKRW
jgi:hypothetical protein